MIRDHNVASVVAAYAILRAGKIVKGVASIDLPIDYMFERRDGDNKMQHPYFGYLPADAPFVQRQIAAVN